MVTYSLCLGRMIILKKFINNINDIVPEMLEGITLANPATLERIDGFNIIIRKNKKNNKVALISGGGSGHEPAHAGYVGEGMLDAAVCGEIFTSPTPDQVISAIHAVGTKQGTLLIIKNYTGDVMNFEMAMEMAQSEGYTCDYVIVNDDLALENSTFTTGKRGIAGTIFVHKIAGAKAETGASLAEVKRVAEKVIANLGSYGISADACTVPANGKKSFILADNEVEIGLGIHGEPGVAKTTIKPVDEFVTDLYQKIKDHLKLTANDHVGVMINGLGGTPLMELSIVARKTLKLLAADQVTCEKTFVGNYMTALEMPGFSISILKLDQELTELLKAKAVTPGMVVV
ncbi:dihydroxyacetone kinase DhaK subunit [Spiroplasma syrphidicola EA-1]|uniref:Dihydroxyacetone kinase DhaK subunit n=1 Tax=Spiroplasma syrphidicola EA-1 TaxID=1276229 RepID=R4UMK9_9MOLU|nr:dihydroxyacetone kinase DhaK subunit [Spiroplasma syrphidicola EA-1]